MAIRGLALSALLAACAAAGPASPVEGIVTDVQVASLTEVEQFSLQLDSGKTLVFAVEPGDPDVAASELREHLNFAIRLKVTFRRDGDDLIAEAVAHGTGPLAPSSSSMCHLQCEASLS